MLAVREVAAAYGPGAEVLRGVSLDVGEGSVLGLMGRNGAGKTTLCRAILGLLRPSQGDIRLAGRSLVGVPTNRIARQGVGYVPQRREVFGWLTVAENLRLATVGAGGGDVDTALAWFPALIPLYRRQARHLSGGEQQMLAVARALAARPRVLLLDEPSAGLQPSAVAAFAAVLARVTRETGAAVLLVEQSLDLVRRAAARCAILVEGRIATEVPARELTADSEIRRFLAR